MSSLPSDKVTAVEQAAGAAAALQSEIPELPSVHEYVRWPAPETFRYHY